MNPPEESSDSTSEAITAKWMAIWQKLNDLDSWASGLAQTSLELRRLVQELELLSESEISLNMGVEDPAPRSRRRSDRPPPPPAS